jgi:hypothetical protein
LLFAFMQVAMRKNHIELIHLNPVLQRLGLQFAGGLRLLDLATDGSLKRTPLPLQPTKRLVLALQRKALTLIASLQRVPLDVLAFRRIKVSDCAAQERND